MSSPKPKYLPPEIRAMIWDFALEGPGIHFVPLIKCTTKTCNAIISQDANLVPWLDESQYGGDPYSASQVSTALLNTCRETQHVVIRRWRSMQDPVVAADHDPFTSHYSSDNILAGRERTSRESEYFHKSHVLQGIYWDPTTEVVQGGSRDEVENLRHVADGTEEITWHEAETSTKMQGDNFEENRADDKDLDSISVAYSKISAHTMIDLATDLICFSLETSEQLYLIGSNKWNLPIDAYGIRRVALRRNWQWRQSPISQWKTCLWCFKKRQPQQPCLDCLASFLSRLYRLEQFYLLADDNPVPKMECLKEGYDKSSRQTFQGSSGSYYAAEHWELNPWFKEEQDFLLKLRRRYISHMRLRRCSTVN